MKAATEAFKHFDKNADGVISYTGNLHMSGNDIILRTERVTRWL